MDTKEKFAADSQKFSLDCHRVGNLDNTDTIASVTSVTPNDAALLVTGIAHDNAHTITFILSAGMASTTYAITIKFVTVAGDQLTGIVYLEVL